MLTLLWLAPAFPFFTAFLLLLFGSHFSKRTIPLIGCGSIAVSFLVATLTAWSFLTTTLPGNSFTLPLWTWIPSNTQFSLYLDPVSLLMLLVVTFVGFWIHLYSAEYMRDDDSYSRFF